MATRRSERPSIRFRRSGGLIRISGAHQHTLKNLNLNLNIRAVEPMVVTGLSGSGKFNLVFDTLVAEGQRRNVETFSAYARQFLDHMDKPVVDRVNGIYVIDPFPYVGIGDASAVALQAYLSEAKSAAGKALDGLGKVCAAEGVAFVGDTIERNVVYEGVIETAKAEGCDLIVMASHGRQGVKALILGSVAQKVLTHAAVPVLIVKA